MEKDCSDPRLDVCLIMLLRFIWKWIWCKWISWIERNTTRSSVYSWEDHDFEL